MVRKRSPVQARFQAFSSELFLSFYQSQTYCLWLHYQNISSSFQKFLTTIFGSNISGNMILTLLESQEFLSFIWIDYNLPLQYRTSSPLFQNFHFLIGSCYTLVNRNIHNFGNLVFYKHDLIVTTYK